jgi:hypothetical protein
LKLSELKHDTESVIGFLEKTRRRALLAKMTTAELALSEAKREYLETLAKVRRAYEKQQEAEAQIFALDRVITSNANELLNEELVAQLKAVLENLYVAVWTEGDKILALTNRIIMEQESTMKADVGQFLVTIDSNKLDYRRADGRIAMGARIGGTAHAPHHSENHICWGAYGPQINTLQQSGDYAQLLLLTYHHLCQVTPTDAYIYLPQYCEKLKITRKIDLLAGQTDWNEPEEPLLGVEVVRTTTSAIEEVPITPTLLEELRQEADQIMNVERIGTSIIRPRTSQTVTFTNANVTSVTLPDTGEMVDVEVELTPSGTTGTTSSEWRRVLTRTGETRRQTVDTSVQQQNRVNETGISEGRPLNAEERAALGITAQEMMEPNPEAELQQEENPF